MENCIARESSHVIDFHSLDALASIISAEPEPKKRKCHDCGKTLSRYNKEKLCYACQVPGPYKAPKCIVCRGTFEPRDPKTKTCGEECLSELGRRNINKRWGER